MSGYTSLKMKRKELEDVYDDFSDFSLSSPARKIRRLDADLPPIMEEEDQPGIPVDIEMPTISRPVLTEIIQEAPLPLNQERALVLYKPVNTSPLQISDLSIIVNGDFMPGLKNGSFWSGYSGLFKMGENQSESAGKNAGINNCLAVVPWVSNKLPSGAVTELSEPMEAEDVEVMEIEGDASTMTSEEQAGNTNACGVAEGLQQWQQQHCMTPQLPPSTATTPVMWSWFASPPSEDSK